MKSVNRRTFLTTSTKLGAGAALAGTVTASVENAYGANDRIRVACVGIRGRGRAHMAGFLELRDEGVDVVALCDIDERVLEQRATDAEKVRGKRPFTCWDVRRLLEDSSIDAISIATPNHWHALATIWACQAGKDVYVEKPVSWCIHEGRQMVEAARKYGRMVQVGTQARSFVHIRERISELQAGLIGDVYMARALCYKRRDSIGFKRISQPPEHVHFDQWLGPARRQPYHANLVHYNWHWFWDFGNGDIGNQCIHEVDLARWGLGKGLPVRVSCAGGRYGYVDQAETPNTLIATFTYEDGKTIVAEIRGRPTNAEQGVQLGNLFYGSEGYLPGANWGGSISQHPYQDQADANWLPRFGFGGQPYGGQVTLEDQRASRISDSQRAGIDEPDSNHYKNFFDAVRSRNREDLNADILEGHLSTAMIHMANIAYRMGRTLSFDPEAEEFVGDGATEANQYLKREYREPFAVPEQV